MLSDNLAMLRDLNGYSQEDVAERIGISRQAYAKWEKGETIPDVERCSRLAELYGTTIDALVKSERRIGGTAMVPAPRGKHIFGTAKINDRGQVVIPKRARELFGIGPNDDLVILGDEEEGIAILKAELFERRMNEALSRLKAGIDEPPGAKRRG